MKKTNKKVAAVLATSLLATQVFAGLESYARSSKRAAWNDASSTKDTASKVTDACYVEDGSETEMHDVYSNVYADSTKWAAYQDEWNDIKSNYTNVALTPGKDASELNFAWYSTRIETPMVRLYSEDKKLIDVADGSQDVESTEVVVNGDTSTTLYPNKVTLTGLTENTDYYYQYYVDGKWSEMYEYSTEDTDSFSFLYVGDPQIGASVGQDSNDAEYHAMNDSYNWENTIVNAYTANDDISFIMSAGDQINQTSVSTDSQKLEQQIEYAGFLAPSILRSIPIATTIGNHDSKSVNYSNHFNNPNTQTSEETTTGATTAGTDYYFTYGNTLFVIIDTNNYNCSTHENVMKEAIESYPEATWKVLMFHQDIYGSGYDHSDSDGMILRTTLTPIIDECGFDAVLQGHDHTYSRTYQISSDTETYPSYDSTNYMDGKNPSIQYLQDNASCYDLLTNEDNANKVIDPAGTVYFEANSSTGSKFYQLIGTQQDYIAARSQSYRPTYSVIDVTDVSLTVKTYDAATNEELVADGGVQTSYTIVKSVEKSTLNTKLTEANKTLSDAKSSKAYKDTSIKNLEDTIAAAEKVAENVEATTVDVTSAVVSLEEAVDGLVNKDTQTLSGTTSYQKTYSSNSQFTLDMKKTGGDGSLSYTSDNTKVATVNEKGVVTLKGIGTAKITVKASATGNSKEAVKTVTITVLPEKAANVSVTPVSTTKLTITWEKQSSVTGYKLYSYNKSTKKYTLIKTIKGADTVRTTVTKLNAGTKYYYAVKAYKEQNNKTYTSESYSKIAYAATLPVMVKKTAVKAGSKRITVSYERQKSCAGYQIQYSTSSKFTAKTTKTIMVSKNSITRKAITNLRANKTYYVRVRAYQIYGQEKVYGNYSKTVKTVTKK